MFEFEEGFRAVAGMVALAIEAAVVLVVAFASAQALIGIVGRGLGNFDNDARRDVWLRYATWIIIALEFALAADIIRSAISPSWDDIGKLGAIAAIRTILNYFLSKDIENLSARRKAKEEAGAAAPRSN